MSDWITDDMVERAARTLCGAEWSGLYENCELCCTNHREDVREVLAAVFPDGPGVEPLPDDPEQVTAFQHRSAVGISFVHDEGDSLSTEEWAAEVRVYRDRTTHWRDLDGNWWKVPGHAPWQEVKP